MKEILFICMWNRFRSKFAEQYFNQINKNKKFKAESVGVIEVNGPLKPIERSRNKFLKQKYKLALSKKSRGINMKALDEAYKIIVVANDVPLEIIKQRKRWKDKFTYWNIKDVSNDDKEKVNKTVNSIMKKVNNLIKELEVEK